MNESKYDKLIAKIRRKRKWVIALTLVAVFSILLFATPMRMEVMGEVVFDRKGLHPAWIVALILLCFFIEVIAYAIVSLPLQTSMDEECDPEKHLILNKNLSKEKNIDHIYATDYLYLGNYLEAVSYSEKLIASPNEQRVLVGYFNLARCQFFLENNQLFRQIASEYETKLLSSKKLNAKTKAAYQKINDALKLMRAISEKDKEKIIEYRASVQAWNHSKGTEGFLNFIKGLAAYELNEKEEAIYRFKLVEEHCSKTIFAELSKKYVYQICKSN